MKKCHFHIRLRTLLITGSLAILTLSIVLVSSYMYAYSSKYIIDRTALYQQKALESVGTNVLDFLDDMDNIAASICENSDILHLLDSKEADIYENMVRSQEISSILSSFVYSYSEISSINIVSDNFKGINHYNLNGVISEEYLSSELIDRTYKVSNSGWILLKKNDILRGSIDSSIDDSQTTICLFKNIYKKNSSQRLGMLLITCPESVLYNMIRQSIFDVDTKAMILNENGMVLSHSDKSLIGTVIRSTTDSPVLLNQDTGQLIITHKLEKRGWTLTQYMNITYMTRDLDQIATYTLILSLAVLILSAILGAYLSSYVTKPLGQLTETVKNVSRTFLKHNENQYTIKEIDILNNQFNHMVDDILTLMENVKTEQQEKHATELKLLQAEINPHFIYNTIELINYIALKNNDLMVCDIVHTFGRFLRLSLNNGKTYLTLAQEIEQVSAYVKLQSLKYEDSFQIDWDINPDILDGYTLNLILQPLVENSLVHGFSKTGGCGHIQITAKTKETDIQICVIDDGTGMDEKVSSQILTKATPGYGVYNVNQRIQNAFGDKYGLHFFTPENGGTAACLTIPYLKELPDTGEK
ncbi:MAG: sensor histidine kinase [Fusicatenibacter sp.]